MKRRKKRKGRGRQGEREGHEGERERDEGNGHGKQGVIDAMSASEHRTMRTGTSSSSSIVAGFGEAGRRSRR